MRGESRPSQGLSSYFRPDATWKTTVDRAISIRSRVLRIEVDALSPGRADRERVPVPIADPLQRDQAETAARRRPRAGAEENRAETVGEHLLPVPLLRARERPAQPISLEGQRLGRHQPDEPPAQRLLRRVAGMAAARDVVGALRRSPAPLVPQTQPLAPVPQQGRPRDLA